MHKKTVLLSILSIFFVAGIICIFLLYNGIFTKKSYEVYLQEDPEREMACISEGWFGSVNENEDFRTGSIWIVYFNGRVSFLNSYTESGIVDQKEYFLSKEDTKRLWELISKLKGNYIPNPLPEPFEEYIWQIRYCNDSRIQKNTQFAGLRNDFPEINDIFNIIKQNM